MPSNHRDDNGSSRSGGRRRSKGRSNSGNRSNSSGRSNSRGRRRPRQSSNRPPTEIDLENGTPVTGILDIVSEGFGFLRSLDTFEPGPEDAYVSSSQIRSLRLRAGSIIAGNARQPRRREKHPSVQLIEAVEGMPPEAIADRPFMNDMVPLVPNERIQLENRPDGYGARIIDLLVPVGKGQRGVIVSPPKAGKTMLLQEIAQAVAINHPEMPLFMLLIDERPEEVTDFRTLGIGTVVASSFDSSPQNHLRMAEIALARCQRLVEAGKDVFLLLDSLTRLTRTANVASRGTGRSLSGGLDASALQLPRTLLGAARNIEGGGSLTILATALVETDSRMDDVIFEEFKGTGNWELKLDRKLAERRIFPAFDLHVSGTRREELLYAPGEFEAVRHLRRALVDSAVNPIAQMEQILRQLQKHETNADIIEEILTVIH